MTATDERLSSLQHDGLTFDVYDDGPADGDVVVLLHGFPQRSSMWREVASSLHERGYRTVALDQRGYSAGARPTRRRDYRLPLLADDTAALIEQIGGPVHLVGHDWGAAVAWVVAIRRPDLVRTLTAISVPHPTAFLRALLTSRQVVRSWYIFLFQLPGLPELAVRKEGGLVDRTLRRTGMTAAEIATFREEIVEDGAFAPALGWYRSMSMVDRRTLAKVSVPTTFLWSDGDSAIAWPGVERTRDYVSGDYELVVLEGDSHWLPTQAPDVVADTILARVAS
jgi:pimeloyl-ACP methyl ester carboxylesterase